MSTEWVTDEACHSGFAGSVVPPFGTRFDIVVAESYPRNLGFSATYNFRDVGGYAGLDGRAVRWRRLFRADSLHRIGEADAAAFTELGVRTVIDLRRPFEVEEFGRVAGPTAWTTATWCSSTSTGKRSGTPRTWCTSAGWPTAT